MIVLCCLVPFMALIIAALVALLVIVLKAAATVLFLNVVVSGLIGLWGLLRGKR